MDDLISRQAAIRWIKAECNPYGKPTLDYETSCRIMEYLDRMPTAQLERKKGKWLDIGDYCVCNQCGHTEQQFDGIQQIPLHTPFCAICGADMRGEQDDETN